MNDRARQRCPGERVLGILGGMGPLASAEFLKTVYRLNTAEPEQDAPPCLLLSDPSFPDRTEALLQGTAEVLARQLTGALEKLAGAGAHRIVVACVTIHHVLPAVPPRLRSRVVSLLDLVVEELRAAGQPHLLLTTTGTRAARLFERHAGWSEVAPWVRLLDSDDQDRLHQWIYRLKGGEPPASCLGWLASLPARYGTDRFVFGCTELHLLQEPLAHGRGLLDAQRIIDPLLVAAKNVRTYLEMGPASRPAGGPARDAQLPAKMRHSAGKPG